MPIYAYRCEECGHAKDVLQKLSDAPLTACPSCGKDTFKKQLTAAGFQLKGTGWYVTDFRDGGAKPAGGGKAADGAAGKTNDKAGDSAGSTSTGAAASDSPAAAPAAPAA